MVINIQSKIQTQVPLYGMTSFRIGGRAKFFLLAESEQDLSEVLAWAQENKVKRFILGGGTNVLVNDSVIDGLVVKIGIRHIRASGDCLDCGAGAPLSGAVSAAKDNGLTGLEWAAGIPGSLGGAVRGNAGAYGGSMSDSVQSVRVLDPASGEIRDLPGDQCGFRYRDSAFTSNGMIILGAVLKLERDSTENVGARIASILLKRNERIPREPSAGSVFKNLFFNDLARANPNLAEQAQKEGCVKNGKVPSAWLIDLCGLKGKRIGGAEVSAQHANFIVNMGDATAADVAMLISYIKQQVRTQTGLELMEEVQYFGF
jgi:UDP-N-acetylmuramate dehydrogenase